HSAGPGTFTFVVGGSDSDLRAPIESVEIRVPSSGAAAAGRPRSSAAGTRAAALAALRSGAPVYIGGRRMRPIVAGRAAAAAAAASAAAAQAAAEAVAVATAAAAATSSLTAAGGAGGAAGWTFGGWDGGSGWPTAGLDVGGGGPVGGAGWRSRRGSTASFVIPMGPAAKAVEQSRAASATGAMSAATVAAAAVAAAARQDSEVAGAEGAGQKRRASSAIAAPSGRRFSISGGIERQGSASQWPARRRSSSFSWGGAPPAAAGTRRRSSSVSWAAGGAEGPGGATGFMRRRSASMSGAVPAVGRESIWRGLSTKFGAETAATADTTVDDAPWSIQEGLESIAASTVASRTTTTMAPRRESTSRTVGTGRAVLPTITLGTDSAELGTGHGSVTPELASPVGGGIGGSGRIVVIPSMPREAVAAAAAAAAAAASSGAFDIAGTGEFGARGSAAASPAGSLARLPIISLTHTGGVGGVNNALFPQLVVAGVEDEPMGANDTAGFRGGAGAGLLSPDAAMAAMRWAGSGALRGGGGGFGAPARGGGTSVNGFLQAMGRVRGEAEEAGGRDDAGIRSLPKVVQLASNLKKAGEDPSIAQQLDKTSLDIYLGLKQLVRTFRTRKQAETRASRLASRRELEVPATLARDLAGDALQVVREATRAYAAQLGDRHPFAIACGAHATVLERKARGASAAAAAAGAAPLDAAAAAAAAAQAEEEEEAREIAAANAMTLNAIRRARSNDVVMASMHRLASTGALGGGAWPSNAELLKSLRTLRESRDVLRLPD
ncbi:hypothetical protein HK405_010057, partial [Cladochytrium tenue]